MTLLITAISVLAQNPKPLRIIIKVPTDVPSDTMWIRYLLTAGGANADTVKPQPNVQQYVIYRRPDQRAKVVIYAPGCQFKVYDLAHLDGSDVPLAFTCDPLPTRTLRAFLPPAQLPHWVFPNEKKFAVVGALDGHWVCSYFLQPAPGSARTIAGVCPVPSIPLGKVGELESAGNGTFQITIPDFIRDPLFKGTGEVPQLGGIGEVELTLQDERTGRYLEAIKPEGAGAEQGLKIRNNYPDPIKFTTLR